MCGIAGTIFRKNFILGVEVNKEELQKMYYSVESGRETVENFIEKCWQYKSNINFLRYCKYDTERTQIYLLCNKIKELSNKWYNYDNSYGKKIN